MLNVNSYRISVVLGIVHILHNQFQGEDVLSDDGIRRSNLQAAIAGAEDSTRVSSDSVSQITFILVDQKPCLGLQRDRNYLQWVESTAAFTLTNQSHRLCRTSALEIDKAKRMAAETISTIKQEEFKTSLGNYM